MTQTIPTAEPFFFPGSGAKQRIGCLVTHGFTGAPKEMRWLGEYLNALGYTVCGIRLNGHASQPADMIRSRKEDWLLSEEDGYNLLAACSEKIILLGLSMGGILSLTFAGECQKTGQGAKICGVVAMSTPYDLPKLPLPQWALCAISVFHPYLAKGDKPDDGWFDKSAFAQHVSYPMNPIRSGVELKNLMEQMHAALPQLRVPVLLMHSRDDSYVVRDSMEKIYSALGSTDKRMLWLEGSGHVITEEPTKEVVFKAAADFIARIAPA